MTRSKRTGGKSARPTGLPGRVRIIGGLWRGRRIPVPPVPDLRPTGDRVRETLFNWLSSAVVDARCLDLFAGSGALGFEALSRGAADVLLVDRSREITAALRSQASRFGHAGITIVCAEAVRWLERREEQPFDVVFLDPPFEDGALGEVCERLEDNGYVRDGGYIYIEQDRASALPVLPRNWRISREQKAGRVRYYLARRGSGTATGVSPEPRNET